ncbi:MAG: long-chain fatty acid--CoA ligase [Ruminococcaceae bacterium]|nr:long-chain fatty acid--CoA ligase [Oscillospiraceae bacterium]
MVETIEIKTPWLKSYGEVDFHLDYPKYTMCDAVFASAKDSPDFPALAFMGRKISYKKLEENIELCAKSFKALGIKEGDRVTLCMPNVPQTVYSFYALNRIGAIAVMIHPLSAQGEILYYLKDTESKYVLTLDGFYPKLREVMDEYPLNKLIITSIKDELGLLMTVGYSLTQGRTIKPVPYDDTVISWKSFTDGGRAFAGKYVSQKGADDVAVILFSGGTTGTTKGIELTNLNFNALAMQTVAMCNKEVKHKKMLAAMPMFHGFGLGVCVHTMMLACGQSVLVPRFNVKDYAGLIKKHRPNYIAGVPTLYEALVRNNYLDGVKLDCLMGVFSGGDSLSIELKKKVDKFLEEHGATVRIREGYGTTECVTASCLTPYNIEKEGSIGLPYPDTYYKIVKPGEQEEMPYGEDGEICITGPSVMKGYLNKPEENANTLKVHEDGRIWLHTGDLGNMDEDGFIYFKQRIKRMIITSGYNVYPSQIENIIEAHEAVQLSCVIGVKDPLKMQKVKAFVVLKTGYSASDEMKDDILAHCRKNIAKYAMPYDIEFREELPKTRVGKIAYTELEREEAEKENA